jgi:hypothetical protein
MSNDVNNITETICSNLQFLQIHEVFMCFLCPFSSPCNVLTHTELGEGGVKLISKRNLQKITAKIFCLFEKMFCCIYCKTDYY